MASTRKIILGVLTALLFILFMFASIMKLTPVLSKDVHNEMKENFKKFSTVFPVVRFGLKPDADLYRMCVACTELGCALLMYLGNWRVNQMVNVLLFVIMVGALYTHVALQDPAEKFGGAIVGFTLVTLRMLIMGFGSEEKVKIS